MPLEPVRQTDSPRSANHLAAVVTYHMNMQAPAMLILSGLPGTGKTTFALALAAHTPVVHLESDAIRRALFSVPAYVPAEHARVFRTLEAHGAKALAGGQDVIVDATNLAANERRRFVRIAEAANAMVVLVRFTAPEVVIRERLTVPREGSSQADFRVYEMMRARANSLRSAAVVVDSRFDLSPSLDLVLLLMHDQEE